MINYYQGAVYPTFTEETLELYYANIFMVRTDFSSRGIHRININAESNPRVFRLFVCGHLCCYLFSRDGEKDTIFKCCICAHSTRACQICRAR